MNIFILEDNFWQQTRIEKVVHDILYENDWPYHHCEVYGKPSQLLADVQERGSHQIFFLDIEIKEEEKKGLEIALDIRKKDPWAIIVFVTTHSEFMPLSFQYQVSALDFIDKELSDSDFFDRIKSALSYAHASQTKTLAEDSFIFESSKSHLQVSFADLLYIETSPIPHKLILHSMKEVIEFYGKLSEVLAQDKRLYQSHRSFVVNPYNLARIDKEERIAYFENGATCLISRLKLKGLLQLLEKIHLKEG